MTTPLYIAYHFDVSPPVPGNEILVAELGVVGFESFVEISQGLSAYIQKKRPLQQHFRKQRILYQLSY
jgi:ribosomal protein L11 methyltransferase